MGNEMGNRNINGLQASEQEGAEVAKTINYPLEASIISNDVAGLKVPEQLDTGNMATNRSSDPSVVSNDTDDKHQSVSSVEFEDFHEENKKSCQNSTSATDDNLIMRWTSETREEEEASSVLNSSSETDEAESIPSIDLKSNEQDPADGLCHEFTSKSTEKWLISNENIDEKGLELGGAMVEGLNKCGTPDSNSKFVENMQGLPLEDSGLCREMVLTDSDVVEGNNEEDGEKLGLVLDLVSKDFTPLQQENVPLTEAINSAFLDAIDSEIKRLLMGDDSKAVDETSKTEPDGNQTNTKRDEETLEEELTTNHIEIDSFEIQLKAINPSHDEQKRDDGGSEDSVIELVQTDESNEIERRHEEQDDYNPSLTSEENNKNTEGDEEILEMGSATSPVDKLVAVNEHERKINCRSEGSNDEYKQVENNEISGEIFCVFSSLSDPIVGVSEDMVAETGELSATVKNAEEIIIVRGGSDNETKLLENNDINEGYSVSSYLLDPVGSVSEEMVKKTEEMNATGNNTEERSGQLDGEFVGHITVPGATMSEEQMYETNSAEIATPDSHQSEPSEQNKDLICTREFEQKHTANESETLTSKELITELSEVSQCLTICSGMPNLADETFASVVALENEKQLQDETSPSLNQMKIQANEVSKVEYREFLDSAMQSQNNEQEFTPVSPASAFVSATTLEALESSGRFTSESNPEKLNSHADDTTRTTDDLEKLNVETVASTPQSQKEDSEDNSLLIYAFERCDHETEEKSASNISAVEVRFEEAKQNPPLDHKQTAEGDVIALERCVPAIEESILRYQINTSQEVISKVGAETEVTILESTNEESDRSPLLYKKSPGGSEVSGLERTDSGKLRSPLVRLLKEEVYVLKSFENKEGRVLKKTVEEVWRSPVKRNMVTSPRRREKQKPRSSLFSNCMCCTTAIN